MSYKKRGREGWIGKKSAKEAEGSERIYAKEEIKQELNKIEAGDSYIEKGKVRKRNEVARLESRLAKAEAGQKTWTQRDSWLGKFYRDWVKELKEKLERFKK